jgi:hypothetical protein
MIHQTIDGVASEDYMAAHHSPEPGYQPSVEEGTFASSIKTTALLGYIQLSM